MKLASPFIPLLLAVFLGGCATPQREFKLSDLSPHQLDELNREALKVASIRLEEMVKKAHGNPSETSFLSTDLFLKGNMSLLDADYETAAVLFKHLVTLVPNDHFLQKKYAIALIRSGDLGTSLTVLENLYGESKDEKIGLILAGVYTGMDKEEEARQIYHKILAHNPKNEDACIFLGKSMALKKETTKAIAHLNKCATSDKKNGMFDYYIGKIYLDVGQIPKAMESFRLAYKKQPTLSQAVSALGILLEERDKHDEAITIYEKFLKHEPEDANVLTRIVQALFLKERFNEVIPYAEKLSDIEPENLNLKVKLGILYTDAKKYSQAISMFKDLLAAAPNSDKILYYLGAIFQETKEYHRSIEYFNQIPTTSGLYTDSSVQMANMLSQLAQNEFHAKAKTDYKDQFLKFVNSKLSEFKDMRVEFSVIKSGYYEGIASYKEAMETIMVVQDEKGFSTQHKYYLANLYEKLKKYDESTALVMGIIEKDPKNAHAWNFLGYSLLVRGEEIDKAYEYIQTALKINPEDGYIRDSLGWYYYKKGQLNKALSELTLAFKKVPDDVEILKHLAVIHKEMNDFNKAKSYYESALKHVRYQTDKQEILTLIEELDKTRVPASQK